MSAAAVLVRDARLAAGLTQADLAERAGLTQSVVARLERPGSNPTVAVLDRALAAAGWGLRAIRLEQVDESQLIERLRLTPDERLRAFERSHRNLQQLKASAYRVGTG